MPRNVNRPTNIRIAASLNRKAGFRLALRALSSRRNFELFISNTRPHYRVPGILESPPEPGVYGPELAAGAGRSQNYKRSEGQQAQQPDQGQ